MSIRRVNCPGCGIEVNVPAAMANVKCPSCATVWNVNNPAAAEKSAAAKAAEKPAEEDSEDATNANAALIAGIVGGAMMLIAMIGILLIVINREPTPTRTAEVEDTIKPLEPEPYRVINRPEEQRKRIYNDYRTVARTTVEVPLVLPQGTKPRELMEDTLQKTFDRELMAFAALHDITIDDVKEVIKEGDAKVWDDSPRSNAVRGGKRVYAKEKSEGWAKNPNRK